MGLFDRYGRASKGAAQDSTTSESAATAEEAQRIALQDKTFRAPRKRLDFQIEAIVGNIVFSTNDVTAYYEIPTTIYDFLSNDKKVAYVSRLTAAINGLAKSQEHPIDLDLKITNTPVDVNRWEQDYLEVTKDYPHRSGFEKFLDDQVELLSEGAFYEKRVYLGIILGRRHELDLDMINPFNAGLRDSMRYAKGYMNTMWQFTDRSVKESEIRIAQKKEKDYFLTIDASALQGVRATTEDLALLVKKPFYPAMPVPYVKISDGVWGHGDMVHEIGGIIETRNPTFVKISQVINGEIVTGYRATLTFKQFPDDSMNVPYGMPWIYASIFSDVAVPFDIEARMSLVPARKIKKDIEKGIAQSIDAYDNAMESGGDPGIALTEEVQRGREMQAKVTKNKDAWLSGTYRLVLCAPSEDDLNQYCKIVSSFYDESMGNIKLVRTFHDQLDLLLESLPGDHLRENSFIQTTNIEMLSASGFNVLNQVGD